MVRLADRVLDFLGRLTVSAVTETVVLRPEDPSAGNAKGRGPVGRTPPQRVEDFFFG
jgi:hypothetical protein